MVPTLFIHTQTDTDSWTHTDGERERRERDGRSIADKERERDRQLYHIKKPQCGFLSMFPCKLVEQNQCYQTSPEPIWLCLRVFVGHVLKSKTTYTTQVWLSPHWELWLHTGSW